MTQRQDRVPWILAGGIACSLCLLLLGGGIVFWSLTPAPTPHLADLSPVPTLSLQSTESTARPPQSTLPPDLSVSLLPVPPLAQGIDQWQLWQQPGSRISGNNQVQIVDDVQFGRVVEFSRRDGMGDGGAAGLILPLDLQVFKYPFLYVRLKGKVISENGGNLAGAGSSTAFPEGAVQVRIKYLTFAEKEGEWYHGFFVSSIVNANLTHFTRVSAGEWFDYISPNLKSLTDSPYLLREIRVYGFGWEFQGQVAEVRLVGSAAPLPSTEPPH